MHGDELLFDTNAFIAWSYEDPTLARQVVTVGGLGLSLMSYGELILGARKSARPGQNLAELARRITDFHLIAPDRTTAEFYADISLALRRKGRPIPTNDVWIAATALQHGMPVLTRDKHFGEVAGLQVVTW